MSYSMNEQVNQVCEQFSEYISQLVQQVLKYKKANAAAPEPLFRFGSIFAQGSERITAVARQLAQSEYADVKYREIHAGLLIGARDVAKATKNLEGAFDVLKTSAPNEQESGWNGLLQSCRGIAFKTIEMLQLVYGAGQKKARVDALEALTALNAINPDDAETDPEKYQGPFNSTELFLKVILNPGDAGPKQQLRTTVKTAKKKLNDFLTDSSPAAQALETNRNAVLPSADLQSAIEKGEEGLDRLLDSLHVSPEQELAGLISAEQDALRRLATAARNGDREGTREAANAVSDIHDRLAARAAELGTSLPPETRERVDKAVAVLAAVLPSHLEHALRLADNPNSAAHQDNFAGTDSQLREALTGALQHLVPSHEPTSRLNADLADSKNAALRGQGDEATAAARKLVADAQGLENQANQAKASLTPAQRQELETAVAEMKAALPRHVQQVQRTLNDGDENSRRNLDKTGDELANAAAKVAGLMSHDPTSSLVQATAALVDALNNDGDIAGAYQGYKAALEVALARETDPEVVAKARALGAELDRLYHRLQAEQDPAARQAIKAAMKNLARDLKDLVTTPLPPPVKQVAQLETVRAVMRAAKRGGRNHQALAEVAARLANSIAALARTIDNWASAPELEAAAASARAEAARVRAQAEQAERARIEEAREAEARELEAQAAARAAAAASAANAKAAQEKAAAAAARAAEAQARARAVPAAPLAEAMPASAVTFDEKVNWIADRIKEAASRRAGNRPATAKTMGLTGQIGELLGRIAAASKSGDMELLVSSGREVAALVRQLKAEALKVAPTVKNKTAQNDLLRALEKLDNQSIQLKILSSVKAASGNASSSDDDRFVQMCAGLGDSLNSIATAFEVAQL